jgi:diadenosine tetraphosphatase ApaH/serine/threonine PP2A family protein phosphatase
MRRLLIADIHATLPAFEAVLADAGAVDEIVCLGDVVGYGPHPAECVDMLMTLNAVSVIGNHDADVLEEPEFTLDSAKSPHEYWLRWTYDRLTPGHRAVLAALPLTRCLQDTDLGLVHFVHSIGNGRLYHGMPADLLARMIAPLPGRTVICGHSHRAIDRHVGCRRVVCLPGIGQWRDGDPRPGYAIQDGAAVTFHYVHLDTAPVLHDIRNVGLPEPFLGRWCRFISTGYDPEWSRSGG